MNYNIKLTPTFLKEVKRLAKKYPSLQTDLSLLKEVLLTNPKSGIDLGNGIYKIRMAISSKGKGKSHGARVIYHTTIVSLEEGSIWLLNIFDKSDRETISGSELKVLLKEIV